MEFDCSELPEHMFRFPIGVIDLFWLLCDIEDKTCAFGKRNFSSERHAWMCSKIGLQCNLVALDIYIYIKILHYVGFWL